VKEHRLVADESKDRLFILWTSGDPEVAMHMVFMYAKNARLKGWWQTVRLVVWGPSASLLARDESLQAELAVLREAGVELQACKACADRYGVSEKLAELGIDVIYMGAPLTEYLKTGWASITI
jgi:hypothetical protein